MVCPTSAATPAWATTGFAVVEASAQYLDALAAFRRWLVVGGIVSLAMIVVLAAWLSRRMTGPLERLASAAERIGQGDLAGAVVVETRDEIGYLASRLDEMRGALRARDERMQMMLAGIAHEVRNPLGGLELYAGLLREGLADQPERLGEIARIEREIGYLKNVVTDFLDFARRPPLALEAFPVAVMLDEIARDRASQGRRPHALRGMRAWTCSTRRSYATAPRLAQPDQERDIRRGRFRANRPRRAPCAGFAPAHWLGGS